MGDKKGYELYQLYKYDAYVFYTVLLCAILHQRAIMM
jgi:hypothetical protein